ncbi:MAG: NUDIX hydrolase [Proteobacteria bacterium]|nr:NUDIX hydrolase [Pseudomonadota bacterium]
MSYTYEFPHPAVTVDIVVFTIENDDLKVLFIQRDQDPQEGEWALPGGFVDIDESLGHAAKRELKEETGASASFLEQLYTFGRPDRDPRERIITVAYFALIPSDQLSIAAGDDARDAKLYSTNELPALAFDHENILRIAMHRVKERLSDSVYAFQMLPKAFTMYELRRVYELFLGEVLDKRNFRKKIIALDQIEETGEKRESVRHRPARLYRVKSVNRVASPP